MKQRENFEILCTINPRCNCNCSIPLFAQNNSSEKLSESIREVSARWMPLCFLWTAQLKPCTMLWKYTQVHPENSRVSFRKKKSSLSFQLCALAQFFQWVVDAFAADKYKSFCSAAWCLQQLCYLPSLSTRCRWPDIQCATFLCVFKHIVRKAFMFQENLQSYQCSELLQEKGHIQSYLQPEPYLKGIFTSLSLSSSVFSSSDARTIPLSVWFSCKGVKNALNEKG